MAQVTLMTQSEYAKHRGVSHVAVYKAIKAGRISTIDGKIDPAVADIQWERNTRARMPSNPGEPAPGPAVPGGGGGVLPAPVPAAESEGRSGDYWDARNRREEAEASIAEMKEQEMRGLLIRADAVRSALAAKIAGARDALLQIPPRLAPVLAAESDPDRVLELLEGELRQAMLQLSGKDEGAML